MEEEPLDRSDEGYDRTAVDLSGISTEEDINWQTLSPDYPIATTMNSALWSLPFGISTVVLYFYADQIGFPPFLVTGAWFIYALINATHSYWYAKKSFYALRRNDIYFRSGILWTTTIAVPISRIQHADLERGPIDRWFGLANCKFFTAGGMSADLRIRGLEYANALKLNEFVLKSIEEQQSDD